MVHVWDWFGELHQARGSGFGPLPISHAEIYAWAKLTDAGPLPWEVHVLRRLDNLYLRCLQDTAGVVTPPDTDQPQIPPERPKPQPRTRAERARHGHR